MVIILETIAFPLALAKLTSIIAFRKVRQEYERALKCLSLPKSLLSEARGRGRKRKAWGVGVAETPGKRQIGSFSLRSGRQLFG